MVCIRKVILGMSVAGLMLFGSVAHALDDDAIDRWLASMQELQDWGEDQDYIEDELGTPEDHEDMDFESVLARSAREHSEVGEIVGRHGYSDTDAWASDGGRIINALVAAEMQMGPDMEQEMEKMLEELEENPHISDEQREQMKTQMEQQIEAMSSMYGDVPEEDLEAVQRRRDDIMAVLD